MPRRASQSTRDACLPHSAHRRHRHDEWRWQRHLPSTGSADRHRSNGQLRESLRTWLLPAYTAEAAVSSGGEIRIYVAGIYITGIEVTGKQIFSNISFLTSCVQYVSRKKERVFTK